jgi:hypothetical protein
MGEPFNAQSRLRSAQDVEGVGLLRKKGSS